MKENLLLCLKGLGIILIIFIYGFALWAWSQNKKRDRAYKVCCEKATIMDKTKIKPRQ